MTTATEKARALCDRIDAAMASEDPKLDPEIVAAYRRLWK